MKNVWYFTISVVVMLSGFILLIYQRLYWGLVILGLGAVLLIHWNTVSYHWRCTTCGNIFAINFWRNLTGVNAFRSKYLFCSQCQRRRWCNPIPK